MANTFELTINDNIWTDAYSASGTLSTSSPIAVHNKHSGNIILSFTSAAPSGDSPDSVFIREGGTRFFDSGVEGLWIKIPEVRGYSNSAKVVVYNPVEVEYAPSASVDLSSGLGKGINLDAWGVSKITQDMSIMHGMFTYNVPVDKWYEELNGVERVPTNATSVNGKLSLTAGATLSDKTYLRTFRNPRYQPNRGHLYSSSIFLPNKTQSGIRDFGSFTEESGYFFRLKSDGNLYACRVERTGVSTFNTIEELITGLPSGFDVEKGNIYDIQIQWRGVGQYKFYVGDPSTGTSKLVHTMSLLGTLDQLSTYNPANPIGFRCENLGDNVEIQCGCVDVSTEGGQQEGASYGSISTESNSGSVSISGFNQPMIAIRSKTSVSGLINTRDTLALLASAYADQRCVIRVWSTRDFTAITENDQSWSDFRDGHLEYIVYDVPSVSTEMTFDTTKADLIFGARVDQDQTYATSALFEGRTDIYLTPGDMFIFTMHRETGGSTSAGVTFEFAEEI